MKLNRIKKSISFQTWLTLTASSRPLMTTSRTKSRGNAGMANSLMLLTSILNKKLKLNKAKINHEKKISILTMKKRAKSSSFIWSIDELSN